MKTDQKIYIIGAGAIGKALAAFLTIEGRNIVLLRASADNFPTSKKRIRVQTSAGVIYNAEVEIASLSSFESLKGIIVLTNKSFGNERLVTTLKSKIGSSPIVLLQNGLGIEQPFISANFEGIYRCVLFVTSQLIDDQFIRFKPVAPCPIGVETGTELVLESVVHALDTPQFRFKTEKNIQEVIWKKAIVNSVFNSVCSLLDVDNGIFHRNKRALEIACTVISECIAIAELKNIILSFEEVKEALLMISKSSDGQLISTLQDIRNHHPTEIDTLNFEIVRIAEAFKRVDQVSNTKLLGDLTKIKSELSLMG